MSIIFLSCSQKTEMANISGRIENLPDETKIVFAKASGKKLDSTYSKDDKFSLTLSLNDEPEMYSISFQKDSLWHYEKLFISNEQIDISGVFSRNSLNINRSKHNPSFKKLDNLLKKLNRQRNQIRNDVMALRREGKWNSTTGKNIISMLRKIDSATNQTRKKFIKDNIECYYALYELSVYKNDYDLTELERLYRRISKDKKESKYAQAIETFIEYPTIAESYKYYDFSAKDQNKNEVVFSNSFESNKKYVLLEFSSNSCPYSIKAIQMLNDLNSNYKEYLNVISFSTDEELSDFNSYSDKICHKILYDGDGTFSETYTKYGVDMTPTYFLFNPEGRLVERINGYGEGTNDKTLNSIK